MENIYFGRGTHEQFEEYMSTIDTCFGFTAENSFCTFLPKLYRPELDPAYHSFVAIENGKMLAAVGAYPGDINICGTILHGVGIGNVGVLPTERKRGLMQELLTRAVDDMIERGIDFSALGGQRQRYAYFSYEPCGTSITYNLGKNNLRHFYKEDPQNIQLIEIKAEDDEYLDYVFNLMNAQPFAPVRDRKELYPILCSWRHRPYIVKEGDRIIGYFIPDTNGHDIGEILANNADDFLLMIRAIVSDRDNINIVLPEFLPQYQEVLEPLCERHSINTPEQFTVLCFRRVTEAYLKLKNTYCPLSDGECTILVHGKAKDENLHFSVKNGEISVTETDAAPEMELDHASAMRFFFAPCVPFRNTAPAPAKAWFPVPLFIYSSDAV